MIIYLGYFYISIGCLFLLIPLLYLELGRPSDFIKGALNLFIGIVLLFKNKAFENSSLIIYFFLSLLIVLYVVEISLNRWNQLTDKEKSKLTTLLEFKKNFLAVSDAFVLGIKNFKNFLNFQNFPNYFEKVNKKKWVRNDKNDNIKD